MKRAIPFSAAAAALAAALASCGGPLGAEPASASAPAPAPDSADRLYLDVHHLDPADVTVEGVAEAHRQDLAIQAEHGVRYERYWVDEDAGTIYCLVRAPSAEEANDVHRRSHGLVADEIHPVEEGILPAPATGGRLFMDTHEAGAGVRAADVADAHRKDLAVQGEHGVRFLEYWVDESSGRIHCLAEAPDAEALIETHRRAHGLLPTAVSRVVAGD